MKVFLLICISLFLVVVGAQSPTCTIIKSYGYTCEEHIAPTTDGWNLSLQRIPRGRNNVPQLGVVFFQHGLTDDSAGVSLNPPEFGLPYVLADAGYDVWLGNNRGNGISMSNNNYNPNQAEFWDFTFDEMARYDLPANINYVTSYTNQTRIAYIGHSEGTIQAFAGFSVSPQLAKKIKVYIALAPVAYVANIESTIMTVLAKLRGDEILQLLGDKEFYLPSVIQKILPDICWIDPKICEDTFTWLFGPSNNINESMVPFYLNYEPNPTSVKNIAHWAQAVRTATFEMYDYGYDGNMQHYNQPTPPQYQLSQFPKNLPTALFTGSNDYLADPSDVALLISQISAPPVLIHNEATYAHMDFIWGIDANKKIYPLILNLLAKYPV
jgi:pimeloyl-ACP methyl ester carboxylesterase